MIYIAHVLIDDFHLNNMQGFDVHVFTHRVVAAPITCFHSTALKIHRKQCYWFHHISRLQKVSGTGTFKVYSFSYCRTVTTGSNNRRLAFLSFLFLNADHRVLHVFPRHRQHPRPAHWRQPALQITLFPERLCSNRDSKTPEEQNRLCDFNAV